MLVQNLPQTCMYCSYSLKGVFMSSSGLIGLEQASLVTETNPGKGNKGDKFSDVFAIDGKPIRSFADFFAWKLEISLISLRERLEELEKLYAQYCKEDGTCDGQVLAENASDELKSLSQEYGVNLSSASSDEILSLIKRLKEQILELYKQFAIESALKKERGQGSGKGIAAE